MQKTSINPACLDELLSSARNAADKGQAQFYTPLGFGEALAAALPKYRGTVLDLTCGDGSLLAACRNDSTHTLLGSDIDPARSRDGVHVSRITRDLCLLHPMLRELKFHADLFALNPPWGLEWFRDRLATLADSDVPAVRAAFKQADTVIDSTLATLMIALDLSSEMGEGLLIANEATLQRLLFAPNAPFAALVPHVWAHVSFPGNPMTGDAKANWEDKPFFTGVLYFARSHTTGPKTLNCETLDPETLRSLRNYRMGAFVAHKYIAEEFAAEKWAAVKEQVRLLEKPRPHWNLWLEGNVIQTHLSRYEELSVKLNKAEAARLKALQGKSPMQLVLQRNERQEVVHVARDAGWRVAPELIEAIDRAILQYEGARSPLYPLSPVMRLGYLDEHDCITCARDLMLGEGIGARVVFEKGKQYALRTATVTTTRTGQVKNAVSGEMEAATYTGLELAIFLMAEDREYAFLDSRAIAEDITVHLCKQLNPDAADNPGFHKKKRSARPAAAGPEMDVDFSLQFLVDHFVIPEVPDIATLNPAGYRRNLDFLTEFEQLYGITLKPFQKQDLARSALQDGFMLGWDTGLGKSWAIYLWPLLKVGFTRKENVLAPNGPVLLVVPGDLHDQTMKEGLNHFRMATTVLDSQATFARLTRRTDSTLTRRDATGRAVLAPGYYITSYSQLTTNGVNALPNADKWEPRSLLDRLSLQLGDVHHAGDAEPKLKGLKPFDRKTELVFEWPDTVARFFDYRGAMIQLWREEFDLFELDCRYANRLDLDEAYDRFYRQLDLWPDKKAAAKRRNELNRAREALGNLVPVHKAGIEVVFNDLTAAQQDFVIREFCRRRLELAAFNLGETKSYPIGAPPPGYDASKPETDTRLKWRIKCISSSSLADECYDAFDVVCVDEGVKMKGEDTYVGQGVRQMDPRARLVASATPVKNRLGDIFRLAWWAAGGRPEAHARFPYRDDATERAAFEQTFLVGAEIQGYDSEGKAKPTRQKVTAQVCNIHRLWKLLGPLLVRRRVENCGEELPECVRKVYRCQLGTEQRRVVQYHIDAAYIDKNDLPAIGAQLTALRQAAAAPASPNLKAQLGSPSEPCPVCTPTNGSELAVGAVIDVTSHLKAKRCPACDGAGRRQLPYRSATNYTPKLATVLSLIQEITARGEQVLVGSAFKDPNHTLSSRLREAGVAHALLDGDTSQAKRAAIAAVFKRGPAGGLPVLLAGVECMAEGHSFDKCPNVILYAYSWAFDKFRQFLMRVRRLTSTQPINVYVVVCDGTIDARLESLTNEKGDSSDLVLDGTLMGDRPEELNFAELLQLARDQFSGGDATVDEALLERQWPALRDQLAAAQAAWAARHPAEVGRACPSAPLVPMFAPLPDVRTLAAPPVAALPVAPRVVRANFAREDKPSPIPVQVNANETAVTPAEFRVLLDQVCPLPSHPNPNPNLNPVRTPAPSTPPPSIINSVTTINSFVTAPSGWRDQLLARAARFAQATYLCRGSSLSTSAPP